MIQALKVMILEDVKADQELVKRQFLKYNKNSVFLVADNKQSFTEKIDWFLPNLILADYNLPDFTGLDAFVYIKETKPFVPFIFITGGLNPQDPIAEVVLNLADGFILKDNINSAHIRIKEIMDRINAKIPKDIEASQKEFNQKLKILKTLSLLQASDDFSGKDEILSLLESVRKDIQME